MKKWILRCVTTAVVLIGSVWFYDNCYLPEFEIISTVKVEGDNLNSVYLCVQVNRWCYDVNEMLKQVRSYYCDLNDDPDILDVKII